MPIRLRRSPVKPDIHSSFIFFLPRVAAGVAVVLLLLSSLASAQKDAGAIVGLVRDPSGAVVAGARSRSQTSTAESK